MEQHLRFGVFIAPFHSRKESPGLAMRHDLELIQIADRLGFDEAWIGEQLSGAVEIIAAPELMIAAAAERTVRIRLGAGVKSLPFHNPFVLAEMMVQLDHMTKGRTIFGVGPGSLASDAAMFGIDPRQSRPRMEMAVTSIRSPSGVMAAGTYGLGVLSLGGTSAAALDGYRRQWQILEETAALHGRIADRRTYRVAIPIHLAETREQARADVRFGIDEWGRYAQDILPGKSMPRAVTDYLEHVLANRLAVIGTVEDAIEHIEYVQKGSGGFGVILVQQTNWARPERERQSFELFARHVIPHFQDQLQAREESYHEAHAVHDQAQAAVDEGVANADRRLAAQRAKGLEAGD